MMGLLSSPWKRLIISGERRFWVKCRDVRSKISSCCGWKSQYPRLAGRFEVQFGPIPRPFWLLFEFWQGWLGMSCMRKNLNRKRRIPIETNRQMCFSENGRSQNTRVYTGILSSCSHSTATFRVPIFRQSMSCRSQLRTRGATRLLYIKGITYCGWLRNPSRVDRW